MEQQQQEGYLVRFQKKLVDLTNQILLNYKVSNFAFFIIKILEYMQIMYIFLRVQTSFHWNFSFISYVSIFINYTSLDAVFRLNPLLYVTILYIILAMTTLTIILAIFISFYVGWGCKVPLLVKISIPILNFFICLFKTILTIPTMHIILITLLPTIASQLNLPIISQGMRISLGIIILLFFLIIQTYIQVLYRQSNPFSDIQFAGETSLRSVLMLFLKILIVFYSLIDLNGTWQGTANILFCVLIILIIVFHHYEIGFYKPKHKLLEFRFLYVTFVVGLLQTLDFYSPYQYTSFSYLFLYLILAYFFLWWVTDWQRKRVATANLSLNNKPKILEEHVIYLINLIDTIERRQSCIELQGYLHYHRRQCRNGQQCPCHRLGHVRERGDQDIKAEFFKLVVRLLSDGRKKFPTSKRVDLLLGLIYHYRIKNPLQAIYAFTKIAANKKTDLIDKLYVSFYLQRVEEEMIEVDEKETNKTTDINKYLEYTNKLVEFQQNLESCTKHHVQFWRLMLDANPQIKRLEDLGTLITRNKDYLRDQFQKIFESSPNSIHLLNIYGKFLLEVTNEESYNVKYLEKAETILKNMKESSKIDEACAKYSQNAQTGVVVISGNEGELGQIVHTNNLIKQLLGYRKSQIIQRNVSLIMPKIYGDQHLAVLNRYIAASQSKVNGHERVVPALNKDGFIVPVTALTKALPTLANGIQIVGFLAKLQQKSVDEDEHNRKANYVIYRTDTEQILGISEGCYTEYHISPSLVYGNASNMNNQLKLKNLFGLSFEKSQQGRIAAALDIGQVFMTINTRSLKDEFIISKPQSKEYNLQIQAEQSERQGVQTEVSLRCILCTLYYGITLKLLAIYPKKERIVAKKNSKKIQHPVNMHKSGKSGTNKILKHDMLDRTKRQGKLAEDSNKNETDDMKNLKDFKNFISIKSQPSAITAISTICLFLILLLTGSITGLIFNWFDVITINNNMFSLYKLTLQTEIAVPQMMSQVEKQIISFSAPGWNVNNYTPYIQVNTKLTNIISLIKKWQISILPYKYYFSSSYNAQSLQYSYLSTGKINSESFLHEEVINNYISQIETIIICNISTLKNFTVNLQNNIFQKYASSKMTEIYSLRNDLNSSNIQGWNWYQSTLTLKKNVIIGVSVFMIFGIILWLILLLPYVLSVTKINNRVLSLFSLIPYSQICKLIYGCLSFLNKNLNEATINIEDLTYYQQQQNQLKQKQASSLIDGSPTQLNHSQNSLVKRGSEMSRLNPVMESAMMVQQKFDKMKNSQDRNKKVIILKFVGISLIILAFILFYLFYSLNSISSAQNNLLNYNMLGKRPSLMRNTKLLLLQFLINSRYQPGSMPSIQALNTAMINEFYNLQANLLFLNMGSYQTGYDLYNNGNICSFIQTYQDYSIFNDSFNMSECLSVQSQVLKKGLKTGIVSVLQDIRSAISQYGNGAPKSILASKVLQYDILTKYIETPMLQVLSQISNTINSSISVSKIVVVVSGSIFVLLIIVSWQLVWTRYLSQLNIKIWRTKGLLNLIPMRIITVNTLLKNEFTSGQLQNAVR